MQLLLLFLLIQLLLPLLVSDKLNSNLVDQNFFLTVSSSAEHSQSQQQHGTVTYTTPPHDIAQKTKAKHLVNQLQFVFLVVHWVLVREASNPAGIVSLNGLSIPWKEMLHFVFHVDSSVLGLTLLSYVLGFVIGKMLKAKHRVY